MGLFHHITTFSAAQSLNGPFSFFSGGGAGAREDRKPNNELLVDKSPPKG